MTKRLSFLLVDANIVIYLFKLGIWNKLVAQCDLHVARTVVGEAHFYDDDQGQRHDFDLARYETDGSVTVFDVPLADIQSFRRSFDPSYLEKLDAGLGPPAASLRLRHDLAMDTVRDVL